jgi:zinc-binding alcohol dehydrogenase family protein
MVGAEDADGQWIIGLLARLIRAQVLSRFVSQKLVLIGAKAIKEDLSILHGLMQAGKVTPVVNKRYRLSGIREAVRYLETGRAR